MQTTNAQQGQSDIGVVSFQLLDAFGRRTLDIVASIIGLLLLAPIFAIVALAIKRDSPGPVFFRGSRIGKNGKPFGILKFRTMFERPASYQGPKVTATGDSRITPLGHWLRDTKINELPQLWNVLVGDMSLVGPRPEDPEIAKTWPAQLREDLLSVRPGITSPATVIFRSEEQMLQSSNVMDDYLRTILPNKLRLDSIYVRRRNVVTDLDVIFMTALLLLPRLRNSDVPETLLYWGPLSQFLSRYLNWFCLDTLIALLALSFSGLLWRIDAPLNIGLERWIAISMIVGLCFSVTNALLGLTRIQWRRAPASDVVPLGLSAGVATLALVLIDFFFLHQGHLHTTYPHLPIGMTFITGVLSFLGFTMLRYRERLVIGLAAHWLRSRGINHAMGERVLLVGAGNNSQLATWLLTRSEFARMLTIVGIVDDDPRKQGLYFDGFKVLGTTRDIPELKKKYDVGLILFTISNIEYADRQQVLKVCSQTGAKLVILPDVMAELSLHFQTKPSFTFRQEVSTTGD